MALAPLESLPTELLDQILLFLPSNPRPSLRNLRQQPNYNITSSPVQTLKNVSLVSARLNQLARPFLFAHAQYELPDQQRFIQFLDRHGLKKYVKTVTVSVREEAHHGDQKTKWWVSLLERLEPESITVIAPPDVIAALAGCSLEGAHTWAFNIPLQTISFRQAPAADRADTSRSVGDDGIDTRWGNTIFNARPWTEILFNESSSLKAYSTYEYYLLRVPSWLDQWGYPSSPRETLLHNPALAKLTSFHYTAIFPFYNHTHHVLRVIRLMDNLEHLSMQIAPVNESTILSEETRLSRLDPNDPWLELETGYTLIAHTVRYLGRCGSAREDGDDYHEGKGRLETFKTWDFEVDLLRASLEGILTGVLGRRWEHDWNGLWARREIKEGDESELEEL